MSIQLVTYANQTVTPTNDAIIYERAIDQNGIFYGCNVTVSGNEVHITGGYGIVCGREFVIQSEAIAVTLAPSGTLDGRLYVRLDLADADAPIQLLTATGNTLPPLEQDSDVNYTNGTWEMELATFTVGVSALSDVAETFETIVGTKQYTQTKIAEIQTASTGFSLTSMPTGFGGRGWYDAATGTVRIYIHGDSSTAITTSTSMGTVPSAYRPTASKVGDAIMWTTAILTGTITVGTDGTIKQTSSNNVHSLFGVVEYRL